MKRIKNTLPSILLGMAIIGAIVPSLLRAGTISFPITGGTGSSTLSGIILGNGAGPVQTLGIGSGLSLVGGSLSVSTAGNWATSSEDYYQSIFRSFFLTGSPIYLTSTTSRSFLINNSTSTITNLMMVNSTSTNATSTTFNAVNITGTGSTTLQNFTALQSTSTNATSTNSFATTASSTNLFAQSFYSNLTIYQSFTYPTTTWSGTTTKALQSTYVQEIWNSVKCFTDAGTINADFYWGSTHIKTPDTKLNASTTNNTNLFNTSNIIPAGQKVFVDMGTPASSPTYLNCTVSKTFISN